MRSFASGCAQDDSFVLYQYTDNKQEEESMNFQQGYRPPQPPPPPKPPKKKWSYLMLALLIVAAIGAGVYGYRYIQDVKA